MVPFPLELVPSFSSGSFPPHQLWYVLFFSAVVCFFFLPYFVGFQLFGLIVAKEGQNQVGDLVESF